MRCPARPETSPSSALPAPLPRLMKQRRPPRACSASATSPRSGSRALRPRPAACACTRWDAAPAAPAASQAPRPGPRSAIVASTSRAARPGTSRCRARPWPSSTARTSPARSHPTTTSSSRNPPPSTSRPTSPISRRWRGPARAPGPTLQVHYLPAAACLRLYLFHDLRQYPAAALRRIAALQAPDARSAAVALGGPACADVHWRWITLPMIRRRPDRRAADPRGYARELAAAIASDASAPPGKAMFWAFVVRRGLDRHPARDHAT